MRLIKWALIGVGLLLLVLIGGVAIFAANFDPNDYRAELISQVEQRTGRSFLIGDIKLSVFPWLGLESSELQLGNAQGFGEEPMLAAEFIKLKAAVLPLFRGALSIDVVELRGVSIKLAKNAAGKTNWEDLGSGDKVSGTTSSEASLALNSIDLAGIVIENTELSFVDAQAGIDAKLAQLDVSLGQIAAAQAVPLSAHFQLMSSQIAKPVGVALSASAKFDQGLGLQAAEDVQLKLDFDGAVITATGNAKLDASGAASGAIEIKDFSLRELLERFDATPLTADPNVLGNFSVSSKFHINGETLKLEQLSAQLDQTELSGTLTRQNSSVSTELAVSELDLDRYLPVASEQSSEPADSVEEIILPVDTLSGLDGVAQLRFERLKVMDVNTSDVQLTLTAQQGLLSVNPLSMLLYEGNLAGKLSLDLRSELPIYRTQLQLSGVQAQLLLKDFAELDMLSGKADADLNLTTQGNTVSSLKSGLNGNFAIDVRDGMLKGINLAHQARVLEAWTQGRAAPEAEITDTDFSQLKMSAKVSNGVASSDDLDLRAPILGLHGAGQLNLPESSIDYRPVLILTQETRAQGGPAATELNGVEIPLRVTGLISDPEIKLDYDLLTSQKLAKEQAKLKEKQAEQKAKLKAKQAELKQETKQQMDEKKQSVEDKLKDKLKKKLGLD